jgi:orotate phosphoribosyltransferase
MVATTLATALSLQTGIRVYIHKKAKEYGTCKLAEGLVLISKFSSSN